MSECRGHRRSGNYGSTCVGAIDANLELLDVALERLGDRMPCHIGHAERKLAHVGIGRQVILRGDDAVDHLDRDRLARLVMHGPQVEELLLSSPVLHDREGSSTKSR